MKTLKVIFAAAIVLAFVSSNVNANNPVIVAKQKAMVMESVNDLHLEEITVEQEMPNLVRVVFHLDDKGNFIVDGTSVSGTLERDVKKEFEKANIEKTLVPGEKYGVNIRFKK